MTARWYTELQSFDNWEQEVNRPSSRAMAPQQPPPHLKVQILVSGYPLHEEEDVLRLSLDWRFDRGPHMQTTQRYFESALRQMYAPMRLERYWLGEDREVSVDCILEDNSDPSSELKLRFELNHPKLGGPYIIPRQDC